MAGSSSSVPDLDPLVDDFYFSALFDDEEIFPISDEKYAQELQLQEALVSSTSRTNKTSTNTSTSTSTKEEKDLYLSTTTTTASLKGKEVKLESSSTGQYSSSQLTKVVVPDEVFGRWESALCESLVLGCKKYYCPSKDCLAMLVDDNDQGQGDDVNNDIVTVSECPNCHRLICAKCTVSWHEGIECDEFRRLKQYETTSFDSSTEEKMAKEKKWRRCPACKFFTEKQDGCKHISCRCGNQFCYGCGSKWTSSHSC